MGVGLGVAVVRVGVGVGVGSGVNVRKVGRGTGRTVGRGRMVNCSSPVTWGAAAASRPAGGAAWMKPALASPPSS